MERAQQLSMQPVDLWSASIAAFPSDTSRRTSVVGVCHLLIHEAYLRSYLLSCLAHRLADVAADWVTHDGIMETALTSPSCPRNTWTALGARMSHTRALLSTEPETKMLESAGEQDSASTSEP